MKVVKELEQIAKKNCTTAQLALGWLISLSKLRGMPEIVPIPGATTAERVKENAGAVELTDEEMKEIKEILDSCKVMRNRYHAVGMKMVSR